MTKNSLEAVGFAFTTTEPCYCSNSRPFCFDMIFHIWYRSRVTLHLLASKFWPLASPSKSLTSSTTRESTCTSWESILTTFQSLRNTLNIKIRSRESPHLLSIVKVTSRRDETKNRRQQISCNTLSSNNCCYFGRVVTFSHRYLWFS